MAELNTVSSGGRARASVDFGAELIDPACCTHVSAVDIAVGPRIRNPVVHDTDTEEEIPALTMLLASMARGAIRAIDLEVMALALFGMCSCAYQRHKRERELTPDQVADFLAAILLGDILEGGAS